MIDPILRKELIDLLCKKSFNYSDAPVFKLVSGQMSKFYVNCKPVLLDPWGMFLVGSLMFETIKGLEVTGVGGLTFGADPIAMATAFVSGGKNKPIKAFSIRKVLKDHGTAKWIEGDFNPGERVVVVDDVATTGGSTIQAIERAKLQGLVVVKAVVLVDRQEGGLRNIQKRTDVPVCSIITRDELIWQWKRSATIH